MDDDTVSPCVSMQPASIISAAPSKTDSVSSSAFPGSGDSGFVLGLHRPMRAGPAVRPFTPATTLSKPPITASIATDASNGVVMESKTPTESGGGGGSTDPSGSIMPPIGGRRKVGVMGVGAKRTVIDPSAQASCGVSAMSTPTGASAGSPVVVAAGRALVGERLPAAFTSALLQVYAVIVRVIPQGVRRDPDQQAQAPETSPPASPVPRLGKSWAPCLPAWG